MAYFKNPTFISLSFIANGRKHFKKFWNNASYMIIDIKIRINKNTKILDALKILYAIIPNVMCISERIFWVRVIWENLFMLCYENTRPLVYVNLPDRNSFVCLFIIVNVSNSLPLKESGENKRFHRYRWWEYWKNRAKMWTLRHTRRNLYSMRMVTSNP